MTDTEVYRVVSDDPNDVVITKSNPSPAPYASLHLLTADEGKWLRKGAVICKETIVSDTSGWTEHDSEITPEEFISILLGEA